VSALAWLFGVPAAGAGPVCDGLTSLAASAVALDPKTPARLYAGTVGGGVFVRELEYVGPAYLIHGPIGAVLMTI
jgi:hypothetical protein